MEYVSSGRRAFALLIALLVYAVVLEGVMCSAATTAASGLNVKFMQWFESNGADTHALRLVNTPAMGRGVLTRGKIREGHEMLKVPLGLGQLCSLRE